MHFPWFLASTRRVIYDVAKQCLIAASHASNLAALVLVAVMNDGSYLLVGYPQGEPAAFVVREDADLLQRGLEGAFGNSADEAARRNDNSNGTAVPGNGVLHIEKPQL